MKYRSTIRKTFGLVALALACGCAGPAPTPETAAAPDADPGGGDARRPARTLALPGTEPEQPSNSGRTLHWDSPENWIIERPSSSMRLAQYRVPGKAGDGECVVFYFGPGQGGDPASNAARWAGQFAQPDGSSSVEAMKVSRLDGLNVPVQLVEVTGTYDGGMSMTDAPAEPSPGSMLLGAIAEGPDAPWFFKFTGPEATVRDQREAFVNMMRSIRPGD